jgi:hypothetical protein
MKKKIMIISTINILILLMLLFSSISVNAKEISKNKPIMLTTNNADHVRNIGSMTVSNGEITITTSSKIEPVYFNLGEKIRIEVDCRFTSNAGFLDSDRCTFKIVYVNADGTKIYRPEEDDIRRIKKTSSGSGTLNWDFTPDSGWFYVGSHTVGASGGIRIRLECKYEYKTLLGEWEVKKTKHKDIDDNWHVEYNNHAPTISLSDKSASYKQLSFTINVADEDWIKDTESSDYPRGDYIQYKIEWGDGEITKSVFSEEIRKGKVDIGKSHSYERAGTYSVKITINDFYDQGIGDYAIHNEEFKVPTSNCRQKTILTNNPLLKLINSFIVLFNL